MKTSSPRFKSLAITAGLTFWFFIITNSAGVYKHEFLLIFLITIITVTQIFSLKISKALDIFANINTKIFVGIIFIFIFSIYGFLFKILRIDLLRNKKQDKTYWLEIESNEVRKMF